MAGSGGVAGGTAGTGGTAGAAGSTDDGGAGGTAGIGGATGSAGMGGVAGSAGATGAGGIGGGPACIAAGQGDKVEFAIVGPDAMLASAPATATVSVSSIDSCAQVTCPQFVSLVSSGWITAAASRFTLTAPGPQQWTVYLRDSVMPPDLIKVGDMFDMTVKAGRNSTFYSTVDQTLVLSRGGNLILFAAGLEKSFALTTPNLDGFGIQVSDGGAFTCQDGTSSPCTARRHAARVSVGNDSATLGEGQSSNVGWLSFTNASFTELDDAGGCDALSPTVMAGFRLP